MRLGNIVISVILLAIGAIVGFWIGGSTQDIGVASRPGDHAHIETTANVEAGGHDHSAHETSPADWCTEHWVPESECTRCNPELVETFRSRGDWCGEHGNPESHCRKCNPRLTFLQEPRPLQSVTADVKNAVSVFFPPNDRACAPEQALIQFASVETPAKIGLKTESVVRASAGSAIEAPAELVFDETKTAAVTTTLAATIIQWRIDPGEYVDRDQILAELESPEMAELKASYLEAEADWNLADTQFQRAGDLVGRKLISQAEYQDAEAHARAYRSKVEGVAGRLRSAGLRESDLLALKSEHQISPRWFLRAADAGTLLERRAPLGELLAPGSTLALIGRPGALWIEAHIRERDLPQFRKDMKVTFTVDGEQFARAIGEIIWVAQYLDPHTYTGLIRAEITSDPGQLKAHMFGRIQLSNVAPAEAMLVSKDAVQWEGCCNIVFIQEAVDRYRPRKVSIERGDRNHYLITSGLTAGELVVTDGSFLLKSELKRESLGVGCAGE